MTLEICCADVESVGQAIKGGADRIELCSALEVGGVTPSIGLLSSAVWKCSRLMKPIPVNVLIRPRPGDFFYTDHELDVACADTSYAVEAGADGIVFGALTTDGEVDEYACNRIFEAIAKGNPSKPISLTFHRAFDFVADPAKALESVISLGFNRILTSGLAPSVPEGLDTIVSLVKLANGRISIMPGGGVSASNVVEIVRKSGVSEIHASAKAMLDSRMEFRRDTLSTGSGCDEYSMLRTDASSVEKIKSLLIK